MDPSAWSDDEWWKRRETGEAFGVPNPDRMNALVNEICATQLKASDDQSDR